MKLLDILRNVGSSILADVVPGGDAILKVINDCLLDDDKLTSNATGSEIQRTVSAMPTARQSVLLSKEFDVIIAEITAHTEVTKALGAVDKSGNSTRPVIARMMASIVSFAVVVLITVLAIAIISEDVTTIKVVGESWPLIIAILGTPTALLRAYFGMRTKEKQQKYHAISNTEPTSALANLVSLFKRT